MTRDKDRTRTISCEKNSGKDAILEGPFQIWEAFQLTKEGQFKENKPFGIWKEYYPGGPLMMEYEVNSNGEPEGKFTKFYKDGKKRSVGTVKGSGLTGNLKFYSKEGKLLADADHSEVEKIIKKYDEDQEKTAKVEAEKVQLIAQKDAEKKKAEISKNWAQKNKGKIQAWYDKAGKLYWSTWLGQANWYNSGLKCRNIGWRLPTVEEFDAAASRGLASISNEMQQPFWSSIDQTMEHDPQRSILLGDHGAWVVVPGQSEFPGKKLTDENAIVCVSK